MEHKDQSVEEILRQLREGGAARPEFAPEDSVDEILNSLGIGQPQPAGDAADPPAKGGAADEAGPSGPQRQPAETRPEGAAGEKTVWQPAEEGPAGDGAAEGPPQPAPAKEPDGAKTAPPPGGQAQAEGPAGALTEGPAGPAEGAAALAEKERRAAGGTSYRGMALDRAIRADELIDEQFYKFFTHSVVMDRAELERHIREEKRGRRRQGRGFFSFLRREPPEEEEEELPAPQGEEARPALPADIFAPQPAGLDFSPEATEAAEAAAERAAVARLAAEAEAERAAVEKAETERIAAEKAAEERAAAEKAAAEKAAAERAEVERIIAEVGAERGQAAAAETPPAAGAPGPEPEGAAAPGLAGRADSPVDGAAPGPGPAQPAAAPKRQKTREFVLKKEPEEGTDPSAAASGPEPAGRAAAEGAQTERAAAEKAAPGGLRDLFGFGRQEEPEGPGPVEEEPDGLEEEEAEEGEEADYNSPQDAQQVGQDLKDLRTSLDLRLGATLILAVAGLYLSLAAPFPLPVPSLLSPTLSPLPYLVANLLVLLVAMLVNYNTVASGLSSLFSGASPDVLPTLAAVAALVQCALLLGGPEKFAASRLQFTVFAGVAVLGLAANTLGKCVTARTVEKNFALASDGQEHAAAYRLEGEELVRRVTEGLGEPQPRLLVSRPTALMRGFLRQSFSEHRSDRTAKWLGWAALLGAAACGALGGVMAKDLFVAFSCFAGALCLASPLSSTLVGALPAALMQAGAARMGAMIPGPSAVEALCDTNVVLVEAKDLFPAPVVRLRGIKTFQKERIDLAILYAASILVEGCDILRDCFLALVEGKKNLLYPVENLVAEVGYGFQGWVDNNRVILGSREMMTRHDIDIPSMDYEKRYTAGEKYPIYLAVSGRLFGMFLVSYGADEAMSETVDALQAAGISLLVRSADFNITERLVAKYYGIPQQSVKVLSGPELSSLLPSLSYLPESEGVLCHIGSFSSFVGGLRSAIAAAGGERAASVVQAASVALALVLGLLLAFTTALGSLSPLTVLLYQGAWLVLALAVPLLKRY